MRLLLPIGALLGYLIAILLALSFDGGAKSALSAPQVPSRDPQLCFISEPGGEWQATDCTFWGGYKRVWCEQPQNASICLEEDLMQEFREEYDSLADAV